MFTVPRVSKHRTLHTNQNNFKKKKKASRGLAQNKSPFIIIVFTDRQFQQFQSNKWKKLKERKHTKCQSIKALNSTNRTKTSKETKMYLNKLLNSLQKNTSWLIIVVLVVVANKANFKVTNDGHFQTLHASHSLLLQIHLCIMSGKRRWCTNSIWSVYKVNKVGTLPSIPWSVCPWGFRWSRPGSWFSWHGQHNAECPVFHQSWCPQETGQRSWWFCWNIWTLFALKPFSNHGGVGETYEHCLLWNPSAIMPETYEHCLPRKPFSNCNGFAETYEHCLLWTLQQSWQLCWNMLTWHIPKPSSNHDHFAITSPHTGEKIPFIQQQKRYIVKVVLITIIKVENLLDLRCWRITHSHKTCTVNENTCDTCTFMSPHINS